MATKLSALEWELMHVLWEVSPLSASEVHERVPEDSGAHVKTVRSLLDRLIRKQAVTREKKHGVWVFRPALERESCLREEIRSFLQRFFDAQPVPLIAHLVKNENLSQEDLDELRALIDAHREEKEKRHG